MRIVWPSLRWWLVGYLAITIINSTLTLGLGVALEPTYGERAYDVAYDRTVLAHIGVGLVVWVVSAWALFERLRSADRTWAAVGAIGVLWLCLAGVVDAIVFFGLLADTSAGAPPRTFYVDNQPWTGLYYAALIVGILVAHLLPHGRGPRDRRGPSATTKTSCG